MKSDTEVAEILARMHNSIVEGERAAINDALTKLYVPKKSFLLRIRTWLGV